MKEDYLWDKSGEDAEIQRLENALAAFRFQENAPPAPPPKTAAAEKPNRRRFFQLGFAFAAFATAVVIYAAVGLQIAGRRQLEPQAAAPTILKRAEKSAGDDYIVPRDPSPPSEIQPAAVKPPVEKIGRRSRRTAVPHRPRAVERRPKSNEPVETLTAEEKYAYEQLMLALSITGSKLKIVRDKAQSIEERHARIETDK